MVYCLMARSLLFDLLELMTSKHNKLIIFNETKIRTKLEYPLFCDKIDNTKLKEVEDDENYIEERLSEQEKEFDEEFATKIKDGTKKSNNIIFQNPHDPLIYDQNVIEYYVKDFHLFFDIC
jgi:hypothetical protein